MQSGCARHPVSTVVNDEIDRLGRAAEVSYLSISSNRLLQLMVRAGPQHIRGSRPFLIWLSI
jgi:hypothetical protein